MQRRTRYKEMMALAAIAGVAITVAGGRVASVTDSGTALERLHSEQRELRVVAKREILEGHTKLIESLVKIVEEERANYEEEDKKKLAVEILGELRAAQAVPVLLDNLTFGPPGRVTELGLQNMLPCLATLIQIGRPAVEGVLGRLDQELPNKPIPVVFAYAIIIKTVEGEVAGKALLEDELNSRRTPPGSVKAANIRAMLKYFE